MTESVGYNNSDRPKVGDPKAEIAKEQFRLFTAAHEGHEEYVKDAKKFNDFYLGKQWDPALKAELEAEGRPALTINLTLSTVNTILGEQSSQRVTADFKPRRDAGVDGSHALKKLWMAVASINKLPWLESEMFADGVIEERGFIDARMDYSESIDGEVSFACRDPKEVIPDPRARSYDPKDWNEVWDYRWMSVDEVVEEFGEEFKKKVEMAVSSGEDFGKHSIKYERDTFGGDRSEDIGYGANYAPYSGPEAKRIRAVCVISRQFYKSVRVYSLVDPNSGRTRELPIGTSKSEAKAIAAEHNVSFIGRTVRKVWYRVTCDRQVLHDDWSPYRTFTFIPYFAYFRRGRPIGIVRNLVDPQEQLNKLSSQELHIVNTTANSGWIVEHGSLHGMTADELREQGSKTGLVIEYNPSRAAPEKIKPNQIPTGIDRISQKSALNIREISGVSETMLGTDSPEVSGVALQTKERRGMVQLQVPMDNLARTRNLMARKFLELVQDFYDNERIIFYTDEDNQDQQLAINIDQGEGQPRMNDITVGQYDIEISTAPHRDVFNDIQFAEALNLRQAGVQIPDHRVIQYSHLEDRDAIMEEVKQATGFGEPSEEEVAMQQRAQEAEIAGTEAEVQVKQASAQELLERAKLNSERALGLRRGDALEEKKLQVQITESREGHQVRKDLATLNAVSSLDKVVLAGQVKQPPKT